MTQFSLFTPPAFRAGSASLHHGHAGNAVPLVVLSMPQWYVGAAAALSALPLALHVRRRLRDRRPRPPNLCPHCGYDVRATPDRCPECGETRPQHANDPPLAAAHAGS